MLRIWNNHLAWLAFTSQDRAKSLNKNGDTEDREEGECTDSDDGEEDDVEEEDEKEEEEGDTASPIQHEEGTVWVTQEYIQLLRCNTFTSLTCPCCDNIVDQFSSPFFITIPEFCIQPFLCG